MITQQQCTDQPNTDLSITHSRKIRRNQSIPTFVTHVTEASKTRTNTTNTFLNMSRYLDRVYCALFPVIYGNWYADFSLNVFRPVFCARLHLHGSWKNSQHPLEKCKWKNLPRIWNLGISGIFLFLISVFLYPVCRTTHQELKESSWTHQKRLQNGERRGASQYSQIDCWNCGSHSMILYNGFLYLK